MREKKDRTGKWLLTNHPESLLRLAGFTGFTTWRDVQPEVVAPKQIPDGLIELTFSEPPESVPALIEMATYPKRELAEQMLRDAMLVYLNRGIWPEAVTFILQPRGSFRLSEEMSLFSRSKLCELKFRWRVVEMWTLEGRALLDSGDIGVVPWVLLTHLDEDPVQTIRECRERIVRDAPIPRNRIHAECVASLHSLRVR